MARLAGIANALYFPTQDRILEELGNYIHFQKSWKNIKIRAIDPCCGDGTALQTLTRIWEDKANEHSSSHSIQFETWGIELNEDRATRAKTKLSHAFHGSINQAHVTGQFHLLFLNPPYDDGGEGQRQEVQFLKTATEWLVHDGLLILIIPRKILRNEPFARLMNRFYTEIQIFDYPEPERSEFNQVIVVARRYTTTYYYRNDRLDFDSPQLPLMPGRTLNWFVHQECDPKVKVISFDPEEWVGKLPAYQSPQWKRALGNNEEASHRPLMMPRPGHQALILAAGQINGCELRPGLLVKGGSEKTFLVIEQQGEVLEREKIVTRISTLDVNKGTFDTWLVHNDSDKTVKWFEEYGDNLARVISASHIPEFKGDISPWKEELAKLRAPGIMPGKDKPEFFPLQVEAACAISLRWEKHKNVNLSGEMGIGKTSCAIVASEISKHKKTIVICPTHLIKKWARECDIITSTPGVAMIGKKISDVDDFFSPGNKSRFLILSKETAKLGSRWRHSFLLKKDIQVRYTWEGDRRKQVFLNARCPACGNIPFLEEDTAIEMSWESAQKLKNKEKCNHYLPKKRATTQFDPETDKFVSFPAEFHKPPKDKHSLDKRKKCSESLWQSEPLSAKGTKRWALAKYINSQYPRQYNLIVDEGQLLAKRDSDQARAVQVLEAQAIKTLAMTGTFYSGRASSLFHILYKMDVNFRNLYKFDETQLFVEHHGLFERVYKEEEYTSSYGYKKGGKGRLREIPGMSPAMIPLMLPSTVFLKLKDLNVELPPYKEIVVRLNQDPKVLGQYNALMANAKALMREFPELLGQFLMAGLGYLDCPEQEENIALKDQEGRPIEVLAHADAVPLEACPKDRYVVNIVKNEKEMDRKVLVFFSQTQRRDARMRVKRLLEEEGLKVAILESSVPPEKREEWLAAEVEKGFDVLLTNGKLVETGLDLLFGHTIIQYGTEYSVVTLRQSIRRSWRLGQNKPIKVIFLLYRNTLQEIANNLIARKMRASEQIDGDTVQGLGSTDETGANFFVELAQELFAKKQGVDFS